jgi:P-type Mg2+ transporter
MTHRLATFWSLPAAAVCQELQTSLQRLTSTEGGQRLARYGLNRVRAKSRTDTLALFVGQFKSPIILILLFAAGLSLFLSDAAEQWDSRQVSGVTPGSICDSECCAV